MNTLWNKPWKNPLPHNILHRTQFNGLLGGPGHGQGFCQPDWYAPLHNMCTYLLSQTLIQKYCLLLLLFFLYLPSAWSIFFSNKMDDAQTHLGPCYYARFGLVRDNPKTSITEPKVCMCSIRMFMWAVRHKTHLGWAKKKGSHWEKEPVCMPAITTMCTYNVRVLNVGKVPPHLS